MTVNVELNEQRSLKHPAYNSAALTIPPIIPIGSARFCFIQTRNAIYDRVEILSENSENLTIKYKVIEKGSVIDRTDVIKRKDIVVKRDYVE